MSLPADELAELLREVLRRLDAQTVRLDQLQPGAIDTTGLRRPAPDEVCPCCKVRRFKWPGGDR